MTAYLHPADIGGRAYLAPADVAPQGDIIGPNFTGGIDISNVTQSSAVLAWSAAVDAVGVAGYERSLDGGVTWVVVGNVLTVQLTGLAAATQYPVRIRAFDAAGNRSQELAVTLTTAPSAGGESGTNYIRCTLATHEGVRHVSLGTLCWALFSQLSPAAFGAPIAKGRHTMTPGSAEVKIAVSAALVPAGWYFLVLSDEDGTTALAAPILVGP